MDVRSAAGTKPNVQHETVTVHSLIPRWAFREESRGTYLEFFDVFEIDAGSRAEPHYHNTHEFYFILQGRPVVQIEEEARRVYPGDLVYIPPNARHSVWPTGEERMRAICFAASYQEPGGRGYTPAELPEVEPTG